MSQKLIIHTERWPKPIPSRAYDWSAIWDNYDIGCYVGHGPTEQLAIRDLVENSDPNYVKQTTEGELT